MRTRAVRLAVLFILAGRGTADAQTPAPPKPAPVARPPATRAAAPRLPTGYLSLNAGAQLARADFDTNVTFPFYTEQADFDAAYDAPSGLVIDLGGGARVWRQLAIGAAVTRFQVDGQAALDARLPHPFFVRRHRELAATITDLERVETAVHVQVSWLAPIEDRLTLAVFGGPTFFRVEQDVITGLDLRETFPFDEAELGSAVRAGRDESAAGFNVGADVMYRLTRQVGVGAVARFSRGTVDVSTGAGQQSDLRVGGFQLTGGLRWLF